jgi:hypothetical protein
VELPSLRARSGGSGLPPRQAHMRERGDQSAVGEARQPGRALGVAPGPLDHQARELRGEQRRGQQAAPALLA